jgi:hypothetical protein
MHVIEKTDIFKFVDKVVYEHGFYEARIFYGEEFVKRITFFPSHWSRKQVIEKIYEAYNNAAKSGVPFKEQGGKYIIEGLTSEGAKIRMYITKNGIIKTAYPVFD